MSRGTVRRYYQADTLPRRVFQQRTSYICTYSEAIADLWSQGLRTARAIHEELRNRGFKGSYYMVVRHLRRSKSELEKKTQKAVRRNQILSPRSAAWLLTRRTDDLSAEEIEKVQQTETGCCEIRRASEIVRDFSESAEEPNYLLADKSLGLASFLSSTSTVSLSTSTSTKSDQVTSRSDRERRLKTQNPNLSGATICLAIS